MNNTFGLKSDDLEIIVQILSKCPEVQKASIFGSRAKGNYKPGSDVDIALWLQGKNITPEISGKLNDETLLPYHFDVQDYESITNKELRGHIKRVGVVFYRKKQV